MNSIRLSSSQKVFSFVLCLLFLAGMGQAFKVRERLSPLDDLAFASPQLRVSETPADSMLSPVPLQNAQAIASMLADLGPKWSATIDLRTGRPTLIEGGAIPWIPGPANDLVRETFAAPGCMDSSCIPVQAVEALARQFLARYPKVFLLDGYDLVLDRDGSGPAGNSMYFLRFQPYFQGMRMRAGSVFFRINNGNLIQVAVDRVGNPPEEAVPAVGLNGAWQILYGYIGGAGDDAVVENGTLEFVPATPKGLDPNVFNGEVGTMVEYMLVWRVAFRRSGVQGTWEALVDARTGDLLRLGDANRYGRIQGGVYKTDKNPTQTEVNMPFPYADYGASSWADAVGNFPGTSGTSTMTGRTGSADIVDMCGAISLASDASGLIDFGGGGGTDCTTPGSGGAGNTHASRTQYWNVAKIKIKAYTYLGGNAWLEGLLTDNVNIDSACNAFWDGSSLNFYQSGGGCGNTGEIPGVSVHEWGHGMDSNDGSGGSSPPVETRADWTAILQTHQSCPGGGFFVTYNSGCGMVPDPGTGYNCGGYGDCCLNCSGVRDADYQQHAGGVFNDPWTPANNGQPNPGYTCSGGGYVGPCGWEDHCESGISTQALWDFVNRDLVGPPTNMDLVTAWQLEDRLFYTSMPTLTDMYTCTPPASNGCGGGSLYTTMRAIDDDGDGTANGTPHAAAIFAALNRHNIACGAAGDPTNQNQTSCPALTTPTLLGTTTSDQNTLNWTTGGANATRYFVYRNEMDCTAGFTRIATVAAPTLTYLDNDCANGTTYSYRVQAATNSDACVSPMSNCTALTPQPCTASVALDQTAYTCNDTVGVTVLDSSPGAAPWTAKAWSSVDATQKTITLANDPPGSANYTGHIHTVPSGAGADQVNVADGATLTVRFTDPDYCGTPNQNVDKTVPVDCMGPVISNVQVINITASTATVTWTTNESANSRVTYGTSTPPGTVQSNLTTFGTSHGLALSGLTPCTAYYFSVTSADVAGNGTTDTNGGSYYTFTTQGALFAMGPFDVESGTTGWTLSGQWRQDTCKAHGGSYAFKVGSATCPGTYASSTTSDLTWNSNITLGAAGHGFHLKYWEYYQTESGYDWCRPQISTNGGSTWTNLIPQYAGSATTWTLRDIDLSAYTGSAVRIRFEFQTDGSVVYEGWYVDDIEISKSAGCSADVLYQSHTFTEACATGSGGGNGILEPGEEAVIIITAVNGGMQNATNVVGTLTTSTPGVTVTDGSATFPDMAALGGSGTSQAPHFEIYVSGMVTCGTMIYFTLHTVSTENPVGSDSYFTMNVGQAGGAVTAFAQDFTGITPPALPAGWTISSTGGNNWVTNATGCAANALMYPYNGTAAANSWAYTPGIALQTGTTYTLNFDQRVYNASYPEILEVRCGTAATPAGQTITILASAGYTNTTCTARAPTFTVPTTGTYYLGFHCTSAANMWNLYIDNINLTYPTSPVCIYCVPFTAPPPPVNNSGANAARFTKGTGDILDVTCDATTCSAEKVIILYGNLGTWTGYAGCAQPDGGATGSTNFDSAGQNNVWYNLVWTQGSTAGHPGFAFNGTADVLRTWTVGTLCGMAVDDPSHSSCP